QLVGRHFSRPVVADHLVAELLAFGQIVHSCALDGGDVNKDVGSAVVRLDETETFGGIEPFYCAGGHNEPLSMACLFAAVRSHNSIVPILDGKFVRSAPNARITKVGQTNIDITYVGF